MMAAMPRIHAQQKPQGSFLFYVRDEKQCALPFIVCHIFYGSYPALVQSKQQSNGNINGQFFTSSSSPNLSSSYGRNSGIVFGERQLKTDVGVHVAVGNMMHQLVYRPAAFAVRRMQLRCIQVV